MQRDIERTPKKQYIVIAQCDWDAANATSRVEAHGPYPYTEAHQVARNMRAMASIEIRVSLVELSQRSNTGSKRL